MATVFFGSIKSDIGTDFRMQSWTILPVRCLITKPFSFNLKTFEFDRMVAVHLIYYRKQKKL